MKRSILTIITFALVLVDLILTAVMAVAVVPEINKVNTLVTKISSAIDLDIASGNEIDGGASLNVNNIATHTLPTNLTINLKKGADGQDHFAVIQVSIFLNTKSDSYEQYQDLGPYNELIQSEIINIIKAYTKEEISEDTQAIQGKIKEKLNTYFASDLVAAVGFPTITFQ